MAPAMVFRDGELELVTGSPGGSRIITIVTEIILDIVDFGMNLAEATEAVRVHDQGLPDELQVERGLNADTIRLLQALGHKVVVHGAWGSAQSILRVNGVLMGAADTRATRDFGCRILMPRICNAGGPRRQFTPARSRSRARLYEAPRSREWRRQCSLPARAGRNRG